MTGLGGRAGRALVLVGFVLVGVLMVARPAGAATGTTRSEAIDQLQHVRASINETLSLFKEGHDEQALRQSQSG
jgi:hypothetical protein